MGDFDRNQTPKTNDQSKKITAVIVLGVVFIGVLGYPMMKHGPQPAAAAGDSGQASIVIPDSNSNETPEQARAALRNDPTASLLVGPSKVDQEFSQTPRNPFVMSETWRSSLSRPADPVNPTVISPRPSDPPRATVRVPLTVKLDAYKLASIVHQQDRLMAIINGSIVTTGMIVDGARVLEIRDDRVILQNADDRAGPPAELTMVPRFK